VDPARPKALVHLRSLGCPKNTVDSEVMLGALVLGGYAIAERLEDADVAIVNTCSFIESARVESIGAILELTDLREEGRLRGVVVTGCLSQRYGHELARELPEVDAFVGTGEYPQIAQILDDALAGQARGVYIDGGTYLHREQDPRLLIGPRHSAYLKVAEGCDRTCAFCAIPGIRGKFQSRPVDSLVREAEQLAREGVRELNVISQDTTSYGKDLTGRPHLPELLRALDGVEGLEWIRAMYLYPAAFSDELIETLADGRRLLPYVDVPLQHASDRILRAMKRGVTAARQTRLVERLRAQLPGAVLRTTFIVGFPGETEEDFRELCDFARSCRFDRVGVFRYSDEEGTSAFAHPSKVAREVAQERHRELMEIQRGIMRELLDAQVGSDVQVLVDQVGPGGATGRLWSQAPEIDGQVLLRGGGAAGEFVDARITGVLDVDLEAVRSAASAGLG
jgi:ribosomal protein S12 methylthiotransferase